MEADEAFLSELLGFLDDAHDPLAPLVAPEEPPPQEEEPSLSAWPPRLAETARQGVLVRATGPKETLQSLRAEAAALTSQLERLRGGRPLSVCAARQRALAERRTRQRAEAECQALREAVYQHTQFVRGLNALMFLRPHFSLQMNLCRYLHRHVRLPSDRSSRWVDFDPVAHDARLHSTMDVVTRETVALTLSTTANATTPFFHCAPVDDVDCHSITSAGVYAIDSGDGDLGAGVRGACVAVRDLVTLCPTGHALVVKRDIVDDASVPSNILYRVLGVRKRNLHSDTDTLLESHVITSYKITDDYAIVLWDFVDDDQLHPTSDTTNITREITGACLIRREPCDDGVVRTVLRSLSTKRYRYHRVDVPERYGLVTEQSMYANEQLFRNIVLDQIAAEKTIFAQAHPQTQGHRHYEAAGEGDGACPCQLG